MTTRDDDGDWSIALLYYCRRIGKPFQQLRLNLKSRISTSVHPSAWPSIPCIVCILTGRVDTNWQKHNQPTQKKPNRNREKLKLWMEIRARGKSRQFLGNFANDRSSVLFRTQSWDVLLAPILNRIYSASRVVYSIVRFVKSSTSCAIISVIAIAWSKDRLILQSLVSDCACRSSAIMRNVCLVLLLASDQYWCP